MGEQPLPLCAYRASWQRLSSDNLHLPPGLAQCRRQASTQMPSPWEKLCSAYSGLTCAWMTTAPQSSWLQDDS